MKPTFFFAALALITQCVAYAATAPCSQYQAELVAMVNAHQVTMNAVRTYSPPQAGIEALQLIGRRNTERLKSLVSACGWPGRDVAGGQAANNAFFVARLSSHDLPFQRTVVSLLENAALAGEVSPLQFAYLSDQVAIAEGRAQSYGTQLVATDPCKFDYAPLDDRIRVEARRLQLKLQPLGEFLTMVNNSVGSNECQAPAPP